MEAEVAAAVVVAAERARRVEAVGEAVEEADAKEGCRIRTLSAMGHPWIHSPIWKREGWQHRGVAWGVAGWGWMEGKKYMKWKNV